MAGDLETMILADINMTKKSLDEGVKHLIDWISKQPHLPKITDENIFKTFILGSKSVERAKERLDKYFTARTKHSDFFSSRDPKDLKWNKIEKMAFLPGMTPEGHQILFFKAPTLKEEIDDFSFFETGKAGFMLLDTAFKSSTLTSGQILLIDCDKVSMELLMKFVTTHTTSIFSIYQYAMPIRVKGCICFNVSPIVETFFNNIFKFFFNEKLQKRYVVLSDVSALSSYMPLEMLPKDYGGKSPSVKELWEETQATLMKERGWLMKEGIMASNESMRPSDQINPNQLHGTFRKLELD